MDVLSLVDAGGQPPAVYVGLADLTEGELPRMCPGEERLGLDEPALGVERRGGRSVPPSEARRMRGSRCQRAYLRSTGSYGPGRAGQTPVNPAVEVVQLTIRNDKLDGYLASTAAQSTGDLVAEFTDYTLILGPHRIELGRFNVLAPSMRLTNIDELRAAIGTAIDPVARYECVEGEGVYYKLWPLAHETESV